MAVLPSHVSSRRTYGASRALAPALGRLTRVASCRGSHSIIFGRRRACARSGAFGSTSCLTVAAFVVVSLALANGSAVLAHVRSIHVVLCALSPALGRLARVASRRGSLLGHLRSTSRARSLRCPRLDVVSHSRGICGRFFRARQSRRCLCAYALNERRLARPRSGPRPSRSGRVSSRLPTRPSSVGVVRALAPMPSARASCLTVAVFVVVFSSTCQWRCFSRARALNARCHARHRSGPRTSRSRRVSSRLPARPSSVGVLRARSLRLLHLGVVSHSRGVRGRFSRTRQRRCCPRDVLIIYLASRVIAPARGRIARVASRRGSPLGNFLSTSRARSLRCLRPGRRVSQSRRS